MLFKLPFKIALILLFFTYQLPAQNCQTSNGSTGFSDEPDDGFGPWILDPSSNTGNNGLFVGSSTNNNEFGDTNGDGDIGSSAWGLYANGGTQSKAERLFDQPLQIGDTFSIDMDNGLITPGSLIGFGFLAPNNDVLFGFQFIGGDSEYEIFADNGMLQTTGVPFTTEGLHIEITLTGSNTISVLITDLRTGNISPLLNYSLLASPSQEISAVRIINVNAGSGSSFDAFFNNFEICRSIVPDLDPLPDLTADCELTPTAPTANGGTITATANVDFPITAQGTTVVTWTYDAGGGSTATQTQNVTINDTTGPNLSFADPADAVIDSCATEVTVPILSVSDNCSIGGALDFDGINDFVRIDDSTLPYNSSTMTIEGWFQFNSFSNSPSYSEAKPLFAKWTTSGDLANISFLLTEINGTLELLYSNGLSFQLFNYTHSLVIGQWHHIAITFNMGEVILYIDGIEVNSIFNPNITTIQNSSRPLDIGGWYQEILPNYKTFDGVIDDFRIWNTVRSSNDILNNKDLSLTGNENGLIAYYNFDNGLGSNSLTDRTINGNNGILTNMDVDEDWISSTAVPSLTLTNNFTGTSDASATYPVGQTTVTWTATDASGNQSTLQQTINAGDSTGPNLSFADPADATIASCNLEVFVPSPLFSDDCAQNQYALDFDGIDDWVTVSSTVGSFKTIEFWLYTETGIFGDEPFNYVFSWNNSNLKYIATGGFSSSYTNETISMVTNFGQIMTTFEDIPPGWNHIAFTGNGSSFDKILINGVSVPVVNNGFPQVEQTTQIDMGRNTANPSGRLNGRLDEVRLWDTARTVQEIADNYNETIDPNNTDLLAYYNFEDGPGSTTASDITSNGNNGALTNMDPPNDWVTDTAPPDSVVLTNDFNGLADASGTYPLGTTTVNWTATDPSGNQSFLTQSVFVGDAQGPTITCEADITVDNDPGECSANVTVTAPSVSDNCSSGFALDFDGTNDFLAVQRVPLVSGLTYQAWVKTTSNANGAAYDGNSSMNIIGDRTNGVWNSFGITNGQLEYHHYTGTWQEMRSPQTINDGEWYHVTVTHDEATDVAKLFINGVEVNSAVFGYGDGFGGAIVAYDTIGASYSIAAGDEESPGELFEGEIDEVRVWNRPLSDAEVLSTYNIPLAGNEAGLVAYYRFNDGPGSGVAADLTGNGNNAALTDMDVNSDWVDSTVVPDITLTNDFNGTADASGTYPVGVTDVIWTATDAAGNSSTCTQTITVNNVDCSTVYTFSNGVWTPEDPSGGVSTAADDIVIESGNAVLTGGGSLFTSCNSLTVEPGASANWSGRTLAVGSPPVFKSNSTSYSSFLGGGINAGPGSNNRIIYRRYVNSNANGNDLVSSPVAIPTFLSFLNTEDNQINLLNDGNAGPLTYAFGPFDKTLGAYVNFNGAEPFQAGVGYRAATIAGSTLTFSGSPNNGNYSVNIVNSGPAFVKWNLIGNPYPSYLKVLDFLNFEVAAGITNLDLFDPSSAAIYGYDGNASNGWVIYNLATTTPTTLIAPGQGFFVAANPVYVDQYDVRFRQAMRSSGNTDDFIPGRMAELQYLKLNLSTSNKSNTTEFYFNQNASLGMDVGYDAEVWGGTAPDFGIYSHLVQDNVGKAIALQALHPNDLSDVTIPLGVNANQGEQLTFSISEMSIPESVNVYLDDVVTNTSTFLNSSDYILTPNANLSGTGRFYLRFGNETLSTSENDLEGLNIYALQQSKEIVVSGQLQGPTELILYDMQGRMVQTKSLDHTLLENRINANNLSSGIYIVEIKNNTIRRSQKVTIN